MAFPVPLGQYVPGSSFIHQMDARIKILLVLVYLFAVFASSSWIGVALCALILIAGYLVAHIPLRLALRGLKPILYILVFTIVFNAITLNAENDSSAWVFFSTFGLSFDGFVRGLFFSLRIIFLTSMTALLTYSTPLLSLADAISSLLGPLRRFKVPVEDISVVFTITLRFIPLTVEEAEKIMNAQRARGVKFDSGSVISRAKAWIPVITPLFINLFRRADHLAAAMETRCYTGEGRTHLRSSNLKTSDILWGILGTASLIALGIFG